MKSQINAVVVDDERLARKDLISMLAEFNRIHVVGEADDVSSAVEVIKQHHPDVIFLDIQMPGASGFELLDRIDIDAKIIFVTAYDEYAIHAFEVNALDYLLKPINPERLALSIERLELGELDKKEDSPRKLYYDDRLFLSLDSHLKFLKINSIICICSAGDYSEVITNDGKKGLTLKSMKEWEHRLPERFFCRIHRSTIINMEYIDRLEEWFNYSQQVYLKGIEKPFIMSRRYVARLKDKLG